MDTEGCSHEWKRTYTDSKYDYYQCGCGATKSEYCGRIPEWAGEEVIFDRLYKVECTWGDYWTKNPQRNQEPVEGWFAFWEMGTPMFVPVVKYAGPFPDRETAEDFVRSISCT